VEETGVPRENHHLSQVTDKLYHIMLYASPWINGGVRGTRSLVLCVCFVDRCLSFCTFSFGYCVVCSSSIYGFWLPLWYLQTLLKENTHNLNHVKQKKKQLRTLKKYFSGKFHWKLEVHVSIGQSPPVVRSNSNLQHPELG
jgi:hypothetical protein